MGSNPQDGAPDGLVLDGFYTPAQRWAGRLLWTVSGTLLGLMLALGPEPRSHEGQPVSRWLVAALLFLPLLPLPWVMGEGMLRWVSRHPGLLNLPNKAYWMAPWRMSATLRRLGWQLLGLGLLTALTLLMAVGEGLLQAWCLPVWGAGRCASLQWLPLAPAGLLVLAALGQAWSWRLPRGVEPGDESFLTVQRSGVRRPRPAGSRVARPPAQGGSHGQP